MDKKTGGAAFPSYENGKHNDGMSLRDYFAAKAMQAIISDSEFLAYARVKCGECSKSVADSAYTYADAMLEQREK